MFCTYDEHKAFPQSVSQMLRGLEVGKLCWLLICCLSAPTSASGLLWENGSVVTFNDFSFASWHNIQLSWLLQACCRVSPLHRWPGHTVHLWAHRMCFPMNCFHGRWQPLASSITATVLPWRWPPHWELGPRPGALTVCPMPVLSAIPVVSIAFYTSDQSISYHPNLLVQLTILCVNFPCSHCYVTSLSWQGIP
jgi:hypothetical protein